MPDVFAWLALATVAFIVLWFLYRILSLPGQESFIGERPSTRAMRSTARREKTVVPVPRARRGLSELTSNIGYSVLGIVVLVLLFALGCVIIYGTVWIAALLYPVVNFLGWLGSLALVLNLLPSAIFRGSRNYCGVGIVLVSYVWGAALWMYATLLLYGLWGVIGMYLGFGLTGFGAVPLAMAALLFRGEWGLVGELIFGLCAIYSTRALGRWIRSNGEAPQDVKGQVPPHRAIPKEQFDETRLAQEIDRVATETHLPAPLVALAVFLLRTAVRCAVSLEENWGEVCETKLRRGKFDDAEFQLVVQEFVFCLLHLTDRQAYLFVEKAHELPPEVRIRFMEGLIGLVNGFGTTGAMSPKHPIPAFVRHPRPRIEVAGMDDELLEMRQREYGCLNIFNPDGQPQTGTVTWRMAEHVTQALARYNCNKASIQMTAYMLAIDAYRTNAKLIGKTLSEFCTLCRTARRDESHENEIPSDEDIPF